MPISFIRFVCLSGVLIFGFGISKGQEPTTTDSTLAQVEHLLVKYSGLVDSLKKVANSFKKTEEAKLWQAKGSGILGFDLNQFNNWTAQGAAKNSSSSVISSTLTAELNFIDKHFFWRNKSRAVLSWRKFKSSHQEEGPSNYEQTIDILNVTTHIGSKINNKLALSALGELRSNILSQTISPSYLDCSVGITWSPENYFSTVLHPINYELIFSDPESYTSSIGSKLLFTYDPKVSDNLQLKSSLNGFMSYKNVDELSNLNWSNGFNLKFLKSIGLGLEYVVRVSPQETQAIPETADVQSYLIMGISYAL